MTAATKPYVSGDADRNIDRDVNPSMRVAIATRNTALVRGRIIDIRHAVRRGKPVQELVLDLSPNGAFRHRTVRFEVRLEPHSAVGLHNSMPSRAATCDGKSHIVSRAVPRPGDVVTVAARRWRRSWRATGVRVVSLRACETPSPCAASA